MSKTDPKHGRWILPLVIAGLVGFTYLFVNALPPAPVDSTATVSTVANTTDGGDGTDTTAPSTDTTVAALPPEDAAFVTVVEDFAERTEELSTESADLNSSYPDDIEFAVIRDGLTDIDGRTTELVDELSTTTVPEPATAIWTELIQSGTILETAAADMLDGLVNSSTAEKRLESAATYDDTAAEMAVLYADAIAAVGG